MHKAPAGGFRGRISVRQKPSHWEAPHKLPRDAAKDPLAVPRPAVGSAHQEITPFGFGVLQDLCADASGALGEVKMSCGDLVSRKMSGDLRQAFHVTHREVFGVDQPTAHVELLALRARVSCRLRAEGALRLHRDAALHDELPDRRMYFPTLGRVDARVVHLDGMAPGKTVVGPAVIESPFTTVVIDPGNRAERLASGSLVVEIAAAAEQPEPDSVQSAASPA